MLSADTVSTGDTASWLTRRLLGKQELAALEATELVLALSELARTLPANMALILGGSYARGEPCIATGTGVAESLSDIDLLLTFGGAVPKVSESEILAVLVPRFPTATVYGLTLNAYRELGTALGVDFKRDAVCFGELQCREFDVPPITERDAYEVFLYALFELASTWTSEPVPRSAHPLALDYLWCRIALNILKSVGMLQGHWAYHDLESDKKVADQALPLLRWRDQPMRGQIERSVVSRALETGLAVHMSVGYGRISDDAVSGSEFDGRLGSSYVSFIQKMLACLVTRVVDRNGLGSPFSRDTVSIAWTETCELMQLARPTPWPGDFLSPRRSAFQEQLLMMKTPNEHLSGGLARLDR